MLGVLYYIVATIKTPHALSAFGLVCTKLACGREQALTTRPLRSYCDTFVSPKGHTVINKKNIINVVGGKQLMS